MAQVADLNQFRARRDDAQAPAPPSKGPQVEDGYTRIANELFDEIIGAPVTDRERRVVLAVVRLTYGWNKKSDRIFAEDVAKLTKMHESRVSKVISELVRRNVIFRKGGSRSPITLNKDVPSWEPSNGSKRKAPTKRAESAQNEPVKTAQNEPTYKDRKDIPPLTTFEGECAQDSQKTTPSDKNPTPASKGKAAPKSKPTALDLTNLPEGVSTDAAKAFIDHRKALKKPLTQRALMLALGEAIKASVAIPGMTPDQAIDEAILAGWQGVKAQWLINRQGGRGAQPQRSDGRKGFAQPMPVGSYGKNDLEMPEWARD
ncbi:replication protein [Halomonas sp. QX-2]|uniref:Replication protein n=1 Tax=Vreelandella sedimenti TaxID=2729618 RepID=A0A7Z0SPF1_9GAMM|nr:replication protein [Halomonas sedimenti]NYT74228.1 replication protein [Halomonas sedimenti]